MNNEVKNKDERFISLIVKHPFPPIRIIMTIIIALIAIGLIKLRFLLENGINNIYIFDIIITLVVMPLIYIPVEYYKNYIKEIKEYIIVEFIINLIFILLSLVIATLLIKFIGNLDFISKKTNFAKLSIILVLFVYLNYLGLRNLFKSYLIFNNHKFANTKIINIKKQNSIFSEVTYEFEVDSKVYRNQQIIYTILLYQPMEVDFKVLYNPRFPNFNKIM